MEKEIIEGNKLIAEFMGAIIKKQTIHVTSQFESPIHEQVLYHIGEFTYTENHFRYNTSWDWLMPVVFKIREYEIAAKKKSVVWFTVLEYQYNEKHRNEDSYKQAVWQAVVEFIKFYNQQTK